jgi:hypothetical protein
MLVRTSAAIAAVSLVLLLPPSCTSTSDGTTSRVTVTPPTEPAPDAGAVGDAGADAEAVADADAEADADADAEAVADADADADADAAPVVPPDAAPSCGLALVWLTSPAGVIYPDGRDPTVLTVHGHTFRLVLSDEQVLPPRLHLYAERDGDAYVELGGCVATDASPNVCSASVVIHSHGMPGWGSATGRPPALLSRGDALIALYETVESRSFALVGLDPESGEVVRHAVAPQAADGEFVSADFARVEAASGDVHVFGATSFMFPGETGTGFYFDALYPSFATPTCTFTETAPTAVRRSADPLGRAP